MSKVTNRIRNDMGKGQPECSFDSELNERERDNSFGRGTRRERWETGRTIRETEDG